MISKGPKSRGGEDLTYRRNANYILAFYRVQATRRLIGGGDIIKKRLDKEHNKTLDALIHAQEKPARQNTCRWAFWQI